MTDWKLAAEARGLTLTEAQLKVLETLESEFAPIREALDWPEEPALEFHVQND